jgi:hypothetical protein
VEDEKRRKFMETAYEQALKDVSALNAPISAAESGVLYEDGKFTLKFYNRTFVIHHPEVKVEEVGVDAPVPMWISLILLHYLVHSSGIPVEGHWISYRELPGATLFEQRFRQMAIQPLINVYGNDAKGLKKAGESLGGLPMDRTGDAAYRFLSLPKIPVSVILYLGEDEIPSTVNILFDAAAPSYLPTEDLSYVGMYLTIALMKAKPK